jgi:glutamate carboxypeptidase
VHLPSHDLLAFCESQSGSLRETIEALVRLESPSDDKGAVDRCGGELANRLSDLDAHVQRVRQPISGDHLRAEWHSAKEQPVLLLGHFDTVWPVGTLQRMPLEEREGRLHGPGIFDMKGGIAVSMLAMRALREFHIQPRVVMLWTADEEVGSRTSRSLIEEVARQSRAVLVLEPCLPDGAAKTSRKGVGEFELVVHGVSAHAGLDPAKGASAIHELARQILALEALQDVDRGITVNVGIVAGGTRPNVIAERASARIDVRVQTTADAARLESALRGLQPAGERLRLEISGGVERPPFERSEPVIRLYQQARRVAAALGRDLGEGTAGGGSDGNFTGALGVPTLDGLGPQGDGAHAAHEHVVIADLSWRAAFLAALVQSLG